MKIQLAALCRFAIPALASLLALSPTTFAEGTKSCDIDQTRKDMNVMIDRDVHVRLVLIGSLKDAEVKKGGKLTMEEMAPLLSAMKEADTQNQSELDRIVAACGWPTKSELGPEPVRIAARIMVHAPPEFTRKHFDQMWASYKAGETSALRMATVIDDDLIAQGKPQRYGTRTSMNADGSDSIEDPAHLEERRRAFGIPAVHTADDGD